MIKAFIASAFCFLAALPGLARAQEPAIHIYARYNMATVYISSVGTLYNGEQEKSTGSGLLVGNSMVITNSHVLLDESNYQSVINYVRVGLRTSPPLQAMQVTRDSVNDLAALQLPIPGFSSTTACPVTVLSDSSRIPVGSAIFTMGYALDQQLSIIDGLVSHKSGANGRWGMNNLINKGNSGGPIFNLRGYLIGFAVAGIVGWQQGDRTIDVDGVNFLIPVGTLIGSALFNEMQASGANRCWIDYGQPQIANPGALPAPSASSAPMPTSSPSPTIIPGPTLGADPVIAGIPSGLPGGLPDGLPPVPSWFPSDTMVVPTESAPSDEPFWEEPTQPKTFSRSFTISETKDDHPVALASHSKTYETRLTAEAGYTITGCNFVANSANQEQDVMCHVDPDAKAATFSFQLTSGPLVNQYRGWWGGTVTLRQELTEQ
jgi:hypothetical protein